MKIKKYSVILGSLQFFIAAAAVPSGILYIIDPSGSKMGTSTEMLTKSPFSTFLIPGLFLFLINGLANAAAGILSFRKNQCSGIGGIVLGLILCLWIIFQVKCIGLNSFLQPLFLFIGIIEALTGWIVFRSKDKLIRIN